MTGTVAPKDLTGILFGTGGAGIFQWLTGFRAETLPSSSRKVGDDLELSQVLAREAPSLSKTVGCRRRKSVLAPFWVGIGPEIPVMVPSAARPRVWVFENLADDQVELLEPGRSPSSRRRRPRQTTDNKANKAPSTSPGKNPTATAAAGNRGQTEFSSAAPESFDPRPVGVDGDVEVGEVGEVEEDDTDEELVLVELVALSSMHSESPSQE